MFIYCKRRDARLRLEAAWRQAETRAGLPAEADRTPEQREQSRQLLYAVARELAGKDRNIEIREDEGVRLSAPREARMIGAPYQPETPAGEVRWTQGDACPVCQRAVETWSVGAHPAAAVPGGDPRQVRVGGPLAGAVLMPCGHWADLVLPPGRPRM